MMMARGLLKQPVYPKPGYLPAETKWQLVHRFDDQSPASIFQWVLGDCPNNTPRGTCQDFCTAPAWGMLSIQIMTGAVGGQDDDAWAWQLRARLHFIMAMRSQQRAREQRHLQHLHTVMQVLPEPETYFDGAQGLPRQTSLQGLRQARASLRRRLQCYTLNGRTLDQALSDLAVLNSLIDGQNHWDLEGPTVRLDMFC